MSTKRWRRPGVMTEEEKLIAARQVPNNIGMSTYLNRHVPEEVIKAVPIIHTLDNAVVRALLNVSVRYMKQGMLYDDEFKKIVAKVGMESDDCKAVISGLITLMEGAIKCRKQSSQIEKDLVAMNVPKSVVSDMTKVISMRREELETDAFDNRVRNPTLESMKWRVDVTLSTSSLSRVMQPCIMVSMTLSDGSIKTFEMSMEAFDKLRYNVAKVLKQMRQVETHPIMAVVDADIERDRAKSVSRRK